MKQLLLLAVSLTLSSVMLAQNPCQTGNTANINKILNLFQNGNSGDVPLASSEECGKVNNDNQSATVTIRDVQGEGAVIAIDIYVTEDADVPDPSVVLNGDNPFFQYSFSSAVPEYGFRLQFNASGSFELAITDFDVQPTDDDFILIEVGEGFVAPVTWTTPLSAKPFGENLELSFAVADQVDVAGYELERAVGTQPFAKVADIAYQENGSLEVDYRVHTPWVQEGSYYRIKQLDFAGTYDYSNVIFVEGNDGAKQRFQMFPNPASDFVRMSLPAEIVSVDLISASGQVLRSAPAAEVRREGLDVRGVSAGLYLVRPVGGDQPSKPQRLVVNH